MALVITQYGQAHLLADALASVSSGNYKGTLANLKIGLWTGVTGTVSPSTVLDDLTEATFTGYAQQVPTFGTPYITSDGNSAVLSGNIQYLATDGVITNTVKGAFLMDQTVTPHKLVAVEQFAENVAISVANDAVNYVCQVKLPNVDYGDGIVID